jgi:uncharacterized membrane protein YqjE
MIDTATSVSILQSARRLATTLLDMTETRVALFSTDLQEVGSRFVWLIFWSVIVVFFLGLGILLITLFIVTFFWDTHRLAALSVGGGVFLAASFSIGVILLQSVRRHRHPFAATLGELAKDRDCLRLEP